MGRPDYIPEDYKRIKVVGSLSELFNENFGGSNEANVILFPRKLSGDFNAAATTLSTVYPPKDGTEQILIIEDILDAFPRLSGNARVAADQIVKDMLEMKERQIDPRLRLIAPEVYKQYSSDGSSDGGGVGKFHVDAGNKDTGRVLCCYNDPVTEGLCNEYAVLADLFRDGHPAVSSVSESAVPFTFRTGDIWRHACARNNAKVSPFVHRAPSAPLAAPRLLLVGDGNRF